MNKKIILSILIILCLLTSINLVLADDNPSTDAVASTHDVAPASLSNAPSAKINIDIEASWSGDNVPDSVTVYILNGDDIVKNITLSKANSWKETVELPANDDNGKEITYSVREETPDGFSVSYSGDQDNGFIISNTQVSSLLGASRGDAGGDDGGDTPNSLGAPFSDDGAVGNSSDDTSSNTNASQDDNSTDDAPAVISTQNDTNSSDDSAQNTTKVVKVIKKTTKAKNDTQPKPIPKTGFPIAVLILVLLSVVIVALRGRKN